MRRTRLCGIPAIASMMAPGAWWRTAHAGIKPPRAAASAWMMESTPPAHPHGFGSQTETADAPDAGPTARPNIRMQPHRFPTAGSIAAMTG